MDKLILEKQTDYANIRLFQEIETGKLALTLDSYVQFLEGEDEREYHKALALPIREYLSKIRKIVILGGGDGLLARELLTIDTMLKITLVDIDKEMVSLCKTYPKIKKMNQDSLSKIEVVIADALKWVLKQKNKFDAVIADFPDPHTEKLKELYSQSFLGNIKAILKKAGIFVIQASNTWINTYFNTEQVFKKAYIINYVMPTMGEAKIVWSING